MSAPSIPPEDWREANTLREIERELACALGNLLGLRISFGDCEAMNRLIDIPRDHLQRALYLVKLERLRREKNGHE